MPPLPVISSTPFAPPQGISPINASGVVPVGTRRFALIDNRDPAALLELKLNDDGTQQGPLKRRKIIGLADGALSDPEGLARIDVGGAFVLVVASSLSLWRNPFSGQRIQNQGLVRIRYTRDGDLHGEAMPGFRDWVLANYPDLASAASLVPDSDGLNFEGLAWDPNRGALLLGVRSPTLEGQVRVLQINLKTVEGPWTIAALEAGPTLHIQRETAPAQGIRDISYDTELGNFAVILGRSVSESTAPFQLCTWDGFGTEVTVLNRSFAPGMKPEGVTAYGGAAARKYLIADDAGGFAIVDQDHAV